MNKFIFALACLLIVNSAAYASEIDRVVADADNKLMTVEGTFGETVNGKAVTLMVLKGDAEENIILNATTDKIEYANILYVDETGAYTKEFGFDVSTGYYTAIVVDESGVADRETIFYANKSELDEFACKIGRGEIAGEALIMGITTYKDMLAVDMNYFADNRNKSMLLAEIESNKQALQLEKAAKLKSVIQTAYDKCKFLDNIENATTWYDVDLIIKNNVALHNITFTDYNNVIDKSKVCVPFIKVRMDSISAFVKKFDELVKANQPTGNNRDNTPSYGGGGGGGSIRYNKKDDDLKDGKIEPAKPVADSNKGVFSDVPKSHWASEPIEALCAGGVLAGMGDGNFAPEQVVTRGELAKIISLAFNMKSDEGELNFADVLKNSWQYPYVATMYSMGITTGKSDSEYGVDDGVSREDLAVFLYRVLNVYGEKQETQETQAKNFIDGNTISDYAQEAVAYMSGIGIINGTGNNRFEPKNFATRAQVAKLVYEMTKILK